MNKAKTMKMNSNSFKRSGVHISFFLLLGFLALTSLPFFVFPERAIADRTEENSTENEVSVKLKELIASLKKLSSEQKDEAIKKANQAIDEMDASIKKLEKTIDTKWNQLDKQAKKDTKQKLAELRKKRTELVEWKDRMRESSKDAWQEIKKGFSEASGSLYRAFIKAKEEFRSDKKKDSDTPAN